MSPDLLRGPFPTVLQSLSVNLNFSFSLHRPRDLESLGRWGALQKDGRSWSGLLGMVQRREFDMCVTAFTMTLPRY